MLKYVGKKISRRSDSPRLYEPAELATENLFTLC